MPKTYADIEDRVLKNINSDTADVSIAIDNAIDFLGNFYDNKKIDLSIATVASQDYIARPTQCKEVERLEIAGIEIKKAFVAELEEIKDYNLDRFIEYDGKINIYPTPDEAFTTKIWFKANFTPLAGVAAAETDVPDELIPLLVSIATWFFLEQQENMYDYTGGDGWMPVSDTWTFLSDTDNPTFTITVPSGASSKYGVGMKIKLVQTSTKYFIITKVENTKLTVFGGTNYVLTNAIISQISYSTSKCPRNFPMSPDKWSVIVVDTTDHSQASPTASQWYNATSIAIPLGEWKIDYCGLMFAEVATALMTRLFFCLSDANNTSNDLNWIGGMGSNSAGRNYASVSRNGFLALTAKQTFYLNFRTITTGVTTLYIENALSPMIIKAVCAYL